MRTLSKKKDMVVSVLLGEKDTWLNLFKTMDKDDTTLHKIITVLLNMIGYDL
jgi:hypothetical protein